jgi:hypothetical protein
MINAKALLVFMLISGFMLVLLGVWIIRRSSHYQNPSDSMKLGKLACVMGFVALVSSLLGYWVIKF